MTQESGPPRFVFMKTSVWLLALTMIDPFGPPEGLQTTYGDEVGTTPPALSICPGAESNVRGLELIR